MFFRTAVASGTEVHVDVEEFDRIEVVRDESGLFECLAQRRRLGVFGLVDVATGLYPDTEESVTMQYDPSR